MFKIVYIFTTDFYLIILKLNYLYCSIPYFYRPTNESILYLNQTQTK